MSFFKKNTVNDKDIEFQRLEMKVNALMAIGVVQVLMLAVLLFAKLFVLSTFTVLLFLVVLGVAGYMFRQQLPSVFSNIFGTVFRMLTRDRSSSTDDFQSQQTGTSEFDTVEGQFRCHSSFRASFCLCLRL